MEVNNMQEKNKKSVPIIYVGIFIVLVMILGILAYPYLIKKDDSEDCLNENENSTTDIFEKKEIDLAKYSSFDAGESPEHKENLKIGDKTVSIEYSGRSTETERIHTLKINGNEVVNEDFMCGGPQKLYTLKDNLVVLYHSSCDISGSYVEMYNRKGIKTGSIKTNFDWELTFLTGNITVSEDKIKFSGSRMTHGPDLLTRNAQIYLCDKKTLADNNIDDDYVVSAEYEVTYLGENIYSEPKMMKFTTIKEQQAKSCNN